MGSTEATGASRKTACAFVPPKPKDETHAARSSLSHGSGCTGIRKGLPSRPRPGFGVSKPAMGGTVLWCTASAARMSPATPAADIV